MILALGSCKIKLNVTQSIFFYIPSKLTTLIVVGTTFLPPTTLTWYCSRLTPSIHPYAVSPDLLNLWLDSMFISPLELSWDIRWCTIATQSVIVSSRKVQLMQTPVDKGWSLYSKGFARCNVASWWILSAEVMNYYDIQHDYDYVNKPWPWASLLTTLIVFGKLTTLENGSPSSMVNTETPYSVSARSVTFTSKSCAKPLSHAR